MTLRQDIDLQKLPLNWKVAELGDMLNRITNGLTATQHIDPPGLPVTRIETISYGAIDFNRVRYVRDINNDKKERFLLKRGDILFSHINSDLHLGKTAVVSTDKPLLHGMNLLLLRTNKELLDSYYLHYLLNYYRYSGKFIEVAQHAVNQSSLNQKKIKSLQIPLAPLTVQKLIVSEIEKQFSRLDEAVAALKRVRASLKRYKASVLKAAVEGKLTEEWRKENPNVEPADKLLKRILAEKKKKWEEKNLGKKYKEPISPDTSNLPELPEGWVWATTDQLFSFVTSGSRGWASYYFDSGPLFLRMGNLDHDTIKLDLSDIQHVQPPEGTEGTRTRVMPGDILISITADVGMIGIVPDGFEEAYINQHVALGRPTSYLNNTYLAWFLTCKKGQDQLKKLQRGATKVGLGLEDIRAVSVPFPPLTEQKAIIEEVDRCFSVVEEIDATIEMNLKRAERLRQAILKKAFSGRLVSLV